jgi:hypothetical protein
MAQSTILNLLSETVFDGQNYTVTGEQYPATGYYLTNKDLQTISWNVTNCTGLLSIEASLVDDPASDDWFAVHTETFDSTTATGYTNLQGNFIWIRAQVIGLTQGVVQYVKVVY